jgi:hypothetical protein
MKKLRLELDQLHVDSFDVDGAGTRPGTVMALSDQSFRTDCFNSCGGTAQCSKNTGCDFSCDFACTDACSELAGCTGDYAACTSTCSYVPC